MASSIQRERFAVAFDCILLAYRYLPLQPNGKLFLSRWPPTTHTKLQNLSGKIDRDVYCPSLSDMCFPIPMIWDISRHFTHFSPPFPAHVQTLTFFAFWGSASLQTLHEITEFFTKLSIEVFWNSLWPWSESCSSPEDSSTSSSSLSLSALLSS